MADKAGQPTSRASLQPGTLFQRAVAAQTHALALGALKPLPTVPETVDDGGITFVVWRLELPGTPLPGDRPQREKPAYSESAANPFLPYDPNVYVTGISDTHVCLLNKYNVFDHHLLLVTRSFEHQTTWLTQADFEALALCMAEFEGLGFYNGGKVAGASQRHKHIQYVPFPLGPGDIKLPIAPALASIDWQDGIGTIAAFPFVHALGRLDASAPPSSAGERMFELYRKLLAAVGIPRGAGESQTQPYNLLATREWMMVVPRSRESYAGVSVNSLGFAGSFLARNRAQVRSIRAAGPISVLQGVGFARNGATTTQS